MSVANDLSQLAATIQSLTSSAFKDRCSVKRNAEADDSKGGWSETPSTPYTSIPCAFVPYPTGQKEIVIAGQPKGMADGDVWLPAKFNSALLNVKESDQLVMAALGTEPERTFHVVFPAPHQGILIQAAVRLVGNG